MGRDSLEQKGCFVVLQLGGFFSSPYAQSVFLFGVVISMGNGCEMFLIFISTVVPSNSALIISK